MKQSFAIFLFLLGSSAISQNADSLEKAFAVATTDAEKTRIAVMISDSSNPEDYARILKYARIGSDLAEAKLKEITDDSAKKFYTRNLAIAVNNMGYVSYYTGNVFEAFDHYKRSIQLFGQLGIKEHLYRVTLNLAAVYEACDDLDDALNYYSKVINAGNDADKATLAVAQSNAANIYREKGEFEKAATLYDQALVSYRATNDKIGVTQSLYQSANIYLELSDTVKAYEGFKKAWAVAKEANDKLEIAVSENKLACIYQNRLSFDTAKKYYVHALDLLKELNDAKGQATVLRNHASLLLRQRKVKEAEAVAARALEMAKISGSLVNIRDEAALLCVIYKTVGKNTAYEAMNGLYNLVSDSLRKNEKRRQEQFQKFKLDYANYEKARAKKSALEKQEPTSNENNYLMWAVIGLCCVVPVAVVFLLRKKKA